MPIIEELQIAYASAPDDVIIHTTIEFEGYPLRFVQGYENLTLGGQEYEGVAMSVELPDKTTGGNQTLKIGFGGVDERAQQVVDSALASGQPVTIICKEWLSTDTAQPAKVPRKMQVVGGTFEDMKGVLQIECSYFDMLNVKWPREIYTAENAPGMKWQ